MLEQVSVIHNYGLLYVADHGWAASQPYPCAFCLGTQLVRFKQVNVVNYYVAWDIACPAYRVFALESSCPPIIIYTSAMLEWP